MKCHNCAASMSLGHFLKEIDPTLYKEYLHDSFKYNNEHRWYPKYADEREQRVEQVQEDKKEKKTDALSFLTSVLNLDTDHPCKLYVKKRKIPMKYWNELYYTENYQRWINKCVDSTKFKHPSADDPRLVIPFKTTKGDVFAYQGRYIGSDSKAIRYITINPNESILIYGLDKVDPNRRYWAFEGPIDSLYIDNSVAAAGSSLLKLLKQKKKPVFVFDNEPRSKEICAIISKVISSGAEIVIWPSTFKYKDVGEAIESGMKAKEVLDIMDNNVYNGLQASLKFNQWKVI